MNIGLTGGIGCGKSTALSIFQKLGFLTASADTICHDLYTRKDLITTLTDRWSNDILQEDGFVNRKKIAEIVFENPQELTFLESKLETLIAEEIQKKLIEACQTRRSIVIEVPRLFEVGWEKWFDVTVAVWSPPEIRRQRLLQRNWSEREIHRREALQFSPDSKLEKADYGLINAGSLEQLEQQCSDLIYCR